LIENALGIGQLIVEEAQWMGVTGLYTYMSRMMRLKREREEGGAEFYRVGILTEAHFTVESGLSRFFCCGIAHFTVGLRLFYSA
jgi:hypothetical protein